MSLIRQVWLLLFTVLALAVGGAVALNLVSARDTLQDQVALKNADNAQALALALSQQQGDAGRMQLLVAAQADTGHYRSIRYLPPDAAPVFESRAEAGPEPAPAWFRALLPIESPAGVAQVSDGWRALGSVEVVTHVGHAYASLWRGGWRALMWMGLVGVLAAAVAWIGVGRLKRPLAATVAQAASLSEGRFVTVPEPAVPELRRVAAAMNEMVRRMRKLFETQATESERWRHQAHCDPTTGLAHRAHFIDRLQALMQREDGAEHGELLLLRVGNLGALNRHLGRGPVDAALHGLGVALHDTAAQAPEALAGRLNGTDFALFLPHPDPETAAAAIARLQTAAAGLPAALAVYAGAARWRRGLPLPQLMAQADEALARAEAGTGLATARWPATMEAEGEHPWRERLLGALTRGEAHLAEYPVLAADGALLHLECPLRLVLEPGAAAQPAARWLPQALRGGLTPALDLLALRLALAAIANDGRPRGVNVAPASLADPGFVAQVREAVRDAAPAAGTLWLEVAERAALEQFDALQEFARQLRTLGVRVGLEHAGQQLHRIRRLPELGIDFVKLDASLCAGAGAREDVRGAVRGCVQALAVIGVPTLAEGVVDDADAQALRACGVGGLTGPWASAQAGRG